MSNVLSEAQIEIRYCIKCRWMLRATWIAQELLTTFEGKLERVSLIPGESGQFEIRLVVAEAGNGSGNVKAELIWDRKQEGRFPEAKEVKQRIRDCIEPERDLGHSDR